MADNEENVQFAEPEDYEYGKEADTEEVTDARQLLEYVGHNNVAELLTETQLHEIGQKVTREFGLDEGSRSEWDEKMQSAMDVAMQVVEDKTFPWTHASNVKYPLLTVAAIQFAARAYPAIVNGSSVVRCKVNGDDNGQPVVDPQSGQVVMQQGQQGPVPMWQVPPGAKRERGDRVGRHMSWQLTEEMEEWEPDTDRLLHVLPIIGVVFRKTWFDPAEQRNRSQMVLAKDCYIDYNATSVKDAPRITQIFELYPHQVTERKRAGKFLDVELGLPEGGAGDEDAADKFLEQHRLLDLDEDGYPEPYIVTVHKSTGKVLRIVARFDGDGVMVNDDGEVQKIEAIQYFTKYGFIPNPESAIYDLGFGLLLNPINESVNSILNQMLDAGTIQNAGGGFISKGLSLKSGNLKFTPNEYKKVDATGAKLSDSIYHMQHPGPSAVLFQLLGLLIEAGKEISSVKDVLTGDSAAANVSPTVLLATIEQGMKSFTSIFQRIHRSLKQELGKLYELNRMYLSPEQYFTLLDTPEAVSQKDYEDESLDVVPVSDPSIVTDMQKLGRAQFLMGFMNDPFIDPMEVRRRILDAASIDDLDSLLVAPPPQTDKMAEALMLETVGNLSLKHRKQPAEIAKLLADAIKSLASAGSEEGAPQIEELQDQLGEVLDEFTGPIAGGVSGMGEAPGGGDLLPVSEGQGDANPADMGNALGIPNDGGEQARRGPVPGAM